MRSTREAARLSLEQAAEELRIEPRFLAALEQERYEAIGVPVFAKGYLKLYCEYLGLDYARLLPLYEQRAGQQTPPLKGRHSIERPGGAAGSGLWLMTALGVMVLALLVLWWVRPSVTPGGPTVTPGGPTETPGSPTGTPGGLTEAEAPSTALAPTAPAPGTESARKNDAGPSVLGGPGSQSTDGHATDTADSSSDALSRASDLSASDSSGADSGSGRVAGQRAAATAPGAPPAGGAASPAGGAAPPTGLAGGAGQRTTGPEATAESNAAPTAPAAAAQAETSPAGNAGSAESRNGGTAAAGGVAEPAGAEGGAPSLNVDFKFLQDSWVEVTDPNKTRLYYGLGKAGEEAHVAGEPPLAVLIGNAEGVVLEVDGKPYAFPRRRTGKVAYFTLKASAE